MSKFANGPWEVRSGVFSFNHESEFIVCTPESTREFKGKIACWIHSEANAKLIAAAPDLLEACKRALVEIDGLVGQQAMCDDSYIPSVEMIRAAIAKAIGE